MRLGWYARFPPKSASYFCNIDWYSRADMVIRSAQSVSAWTAAFLRGHMYIWAIVFCRFAETWISFPRPFVVPVESRFRLPSVRRHFPFSFPHWYVYGRYLMFSSVRALLSPPMEAGRGRPRDRFRRWFIASPEAGAFPLYVSVKLT